MAAQWGSLLGLPWPNGCPFKAHYTLLLLFYCPYTISDFGQHLIYHRNMRFQKAGVLFVLFSAVPAAHGGIFCRVGTLSTQLFIYPSVPSRALRITATAVLVQ